ncbi:MOSC N-terminal beta barrel domain-containing protein [Paraburkholderia sp. CNPSo 3274]|uniref:MOSC domain-containing protein n=1 Tax=Paraburkholderia sp. CNPSo 3274 TaxID=2940932 RepID=UPI0020B6A047|nr:MOSC N-terminal beta barrel domain-containing protein [Paraburkholderia sp. CNPSo 3274]MCP3712032.1 MOSC N-terminal beta barrel domain-containing protein [Paraburkholderia sp. CNPSo 3274]
MPIVRALFVYPVKSCGAIALDDAQLGLKGIEWDRHWMVADENGRLVTQRQYAAMALIVPTFVEDGVRLTMEGMSDALHLPFAPRGGEARVPASVWDDDFEALDEGDHAAQWFTQAIGVPVRLLRFAHDVTRLASKKWTSGEDAPTQFADGFPILVTSEASLAELNERLAAKGAPPVPMARFRPNIVVGDVGDAFEEDFIDTLAIESATGGEEIVLRFVKPCARCPITTIDQQTGERDAQWPTEPLDTLAVFRADPRVDGGLTFGQNAMVVTGAGKRVAVGARAAWEYRFDE